MLQLRDLPTPEILEKFAERYPDADVTAISSFLYLTKCGLKWKIKCLKMKQFGNSPTKKDFLMLFQL